jgi:Flp pilus assembly protein TadD
VSCHMPATTYMQIDARRDHSLRVPRPDQTVLFGVPNACNGCHTDRDAKWAAARVRDWYGHVPIGYQRFTAAFAADEHDSSNAAQALSNVARDSTEPAIVRASALARLAGRPGEIAFAAAPASAHDSSGLVRRAALQLLEAAPPEQRPAVAASLLADPLLAVRLEAAWVLAPSFRLLDARDAQAFSRAAAEFETSQRLHADRAENRVTLGIFFAAVDRAADAEAEYRAAIRLAPTFAPAYVNLADLLRARGDEAHAERILNDGLAASPNDATLHHALGLLFARASKSDDALRELGRAVSLEPSNARFAYVYAVALEGNHRLPEAIRVLKRALLAHPRDHDLALLLQSIGRER